MLRSPALRFLLVAGLLLVSTLLLSDAFTSRPAPSPGMLLAGPRAIAQRQAISDQEKLRPEEGTAAELLLQQEEELAQIRQWQGSRAGAPR